MSKMADITKTLNIAPKITEYKNVKDFKVKNN